MRLHSRQESCHQPPRDKDVGPTHRRCWGAADVIRLSLAQCLLPGQVPSPGGVVAESFQSSGLQGHRTTIHPQGWGSSKGLWGAGSGSSFRDNRGQLLTMVRWGWG